MYAYSGLIQSIISNEPLLTYAFTSMSMYGFAYVECPYQD